MKNLFDRTKARFLNTVRHVFVLEKPEAATAKGWKEWERTAMREQPVAYWINEVAIDRIVRNLTKVTGFYNDLRYGIKYRFFDRYHLINTGLNPGYHDADERMLHGMFNLLVDFVEIEKAWMHVVFDREEREKRKYPWWSIGWTRFKSFRDPEAGIDHLRWETTLDNPDLSQAERSSTQAQTARELLVLYYWWKDVRPKRLDPMDASGWSDYCDQRRKASSEKNNGDPDFWDFIDTEDDSPEERAKTSEILEKCRKIDEEYAQEDEEMLIRLIKVRKAMWT